MNSFRIKLTAFSCILVTGLCLQAADWPQFRGADGQGHAVGGNLPIDWSPTQNVAWKVEIPGSGWASPAVVAGRVYLTTAVPVDGGKQSLKVLCLEAKDGRILWQREVFSVTPLNGHKKNSHASPSPIVDADLVYAHFGPYGTAAVDLKGEVVWRNEELKFPPVHGNGGSPALADNALIFSCDGASAPSIAALDKKTGKLLWRTPREFGAKRTFSFSTPLVITNEGRAMVISPASAGVAAYDPKSGKELWRVRYTEGYSVVPRPVFGHGLLFVSSSFDRPVVYAIRPNGSGDVTESHVAWTINKGAPNTPSPLLGGEELYFISDSGILTCADAKSGAVHWSERVGGNFSASPIYADGKIYLQSEEGVGTVLRPGKQFTVLAKNDLKERALASYAVAESALFIRTASHLYRVQNQGK